MQSLFKKFFDILEEVIENKKTTAVYWFSGHEVIPPLAAMHKEDHCAHTGDTKTVDKKHSILSKSRIGRRK